MDKQQILVVDDEPNIVQLARLYLERDGYAVSSVGNGQKALDAVRGQHPDLVVLDVMLPQVDGFEVCRRLRAEDNPVPIIMVTARDDDIDKILGLELGADDYLTKPFNPRELVARVRAVLRRGIPPQSQTTEASIQVGDLKIDLAGREIRINGQSVELRTQEFEVLKVLADNKGVVLSREQLLSKAWGYDFYGQTRTVDVHIAQLRRKIAASQVQIETVTGIGYKLVV
ncbi:MAG: response regulator transcription factor [Anaerolineaceae bacterium]|nr:response regulator transcription factor [Anaerolineaceae bacterium]